MPLYHVIETGTGQLRVRAWRRQAVRTLILLSLTLLGGTVGLFLLEPANQPLPQISPAE